MARILTSEKDNEMTQTTNINITCDAKSDNDVSASQPTFYPSVTPNVSPIVYPPTTTRDIDLTSEIQDKDKEIKFLETLLQEYQNKPIIVRDFLICRYKNLLQLIKIACDADKVEFLLDDSISCNDCCTGDKYSYITTILVTKNGKSEEFKYAYNSIYSKFRKYGINLKMVY